MPVKVKNWLQLALLIALHPGKTLKLSPIMFCYILYQNQSIKSLWDKFQLCGANILQVTPLNNLLRGMSSSSYALQVQSKNQQK